MIQMSPTRERCHDADLAPHRVKRHQPRCSYRDIMLVGHFVTGWQVFQLAIMRGLRGSTSLHKFSPTVGRPSPHPHGRALHPMFRLSPKTNACGTVTNLEAGLPTTAFHRLLTFNGQPKVLSQSCAEHGRASLEVSEVEWNTDRFSDSAPIIVVLLCISIQYSRVNPRRRLA
jgi:hypothetical protein